MIKSSNIAENRENLLRVAEAAFLERSFREVSMRELSRRSGIGLGNIYNYVESKEEIFDILVSPTIRYIEQKLVRHNDEEYLTLDFFYDEHYTSMAVNEMEELILHYRKGLLLLFYHAKGSHYENYRGELIKKSSETGTLYFKKMKEKYPDINTDVSPIFINVMGAMFVSILENLIAVNNITKDIIYDVIQTYIKFTTAGWQSVMNIEYDGNNQ